MSDPGLTIDTARDWLNRFRQHVTEQRDYLTELDSAIGDADHGTNMARGMTAATAALEETPPATLGELFKTVGMTLVTTVGGASGPLYGTFFLRLGMSAGTADTLDAAAVGRGLRAGLEGVVSRGKAEPGDKTMYDAIAPAIDALEAALGDGEDLVTATEAGGKAATSGRDATAAWVARKGRASYLGERSVGHIDPGAASSVLMFDALARAVADPAR